MPRRVPKYRHYKPKNLGVVRIDGRDMYLGRYDAPESWEKYHRLIAEHLSTSGRPLPASKSDSDSATDLSINHLMLRYWRFAKSEYQRDGKPTKELACMRDALRPLRKLYGSMTGSEFGPLKLKTIREHMITEQDLCRNEINKRIGRIKRFFRWCVSEELVPPSLVHALDSVKGLRKNKSAARETEKVRPVSDQDVEALFPFIPPQLIAMIKVQKLTGMRPSEVCRLRACDIDMETQSGVWVYFPDRHKKDWKDVARAVAIGPQAQAVIEPFLDRAIEVHFFSPAEAYEWHLDNRRARTSTERKTKVYPCELKARKKAKEARRRNKSKRPQFYTAETYWKSLYYAFRRAEKEGVKLNRWFPYQLRHSRGTELRKQYGIEASRVTLGHSRLDATEVYAEKDLMLAIKIALEVG